MPLRFKTWAQDLAKRSQWLAEVEKRKGGHAARAEEFRRNFEREQQEIYNRNMANRGYSPHSVEAMLRRLSS